MVGIEPPTLRLMANLLYLQLKITSEQHNGCVQTATSSVNKHPHWYVCMMLLFGNLLDRHALKLTTQCEKEIDKLRELICSATLCNFGNHLAASLLRPEKDCAKAVMLVVVRPRLN